jgi:lipoprotein Spr
LKQKFVLFFLSCFIFVAVVHATDRNFSNKESAADSEQVKLELCFLFSNLFGYNITEIRNPDLYRVAADWMGTPYKYGGRSKRGIDCSGFTCQILQKSYNKVINGSALELYKTSVHILRPELQEGDLVFFKIHRKRVSHVGIYLGMNKFVHASRSNGVIVSDLNEPYYSKYFYKGGRIKE